MKRLLQVYDTFGRLYRRLNLIRRNGMRRLAVVPFDDGLDQSIGTPAGRNGNFKIRQLGNGQPHFRRQLVQGIHKSVITAAALRRVFINFSVVFNLNIGTGFHPHGGGHHTVQHPKCFIALTAQHIRHQKRQIVNRNAFLQITKLDNFLQQLFFLLIIQINPQFLQVDFQTGLAGQLAQRIIAVTVKTVRSQPTDIKVALFVTVGMNSRRLRKYVLPSTGILAAIRLPLNVSTSMLMSFSFFSFTFVVKPVWS